MSIPHPSIRYQKWPEMSKNESSFFIATLRRLRKLKLWFRDDVMLTKFPLQCDLLVMTRARIYM